MPSERTVRCRQWGPVPGDGAMSRWNGFRRNTMLGFHSRKSIVFDCGAPGAPQSRRLGCNAASAAAPKTRREELSRIASVNLKKASSGCRSAVSSRVLAFCVMVVCLVATLGVTAANLRLTYVTDSNGAQAGDPHLCHRPRKGHEPLRHPVRRGRQGLLHGVQRQPCHP